MKKCKIQPHKQSELELQNVNITNEIIHIISLQGTRIHEHTQVDNMRSTINRVWRSPVKLPTRIWSACQLKSLVSNFRYACRTNITCNTRVFLVNDKIPIAPNLTQEANYLVKSNCSYLEWYSFP